METLNTKELFTQLQEAQENIYNDASLGEINLLDALLYMRCFKEKAELILEKVKEFESDFISEISLEASNYNNSYLGYDITEIKGREMFSFKNIKEHKELTKQIKDTEETYKQAFKMHQKGQITVVDNEWMDANGELKPFPEYSRGKGYLKVTKQK